LVGLVDFFLFFAAGGVLSCASLTRQGRERPLVIFMPGPLAVFRIRRVQIFRFSAEPNDPRSLLSGGGGMENSSSDTFTLWVL